MAKPSKLVFVGGKPTLVPYDEHVRKDNDQQYNRNRKNDQSDYLKFYHSKEWQNTRATVLARDYRLCQRCGLEGSLVDHIIPSKDDWQDRTNIDNLQTLCRDCHKLKTKREWTKHNKGSERYMQIHIVCGLPASGKTTYVERHRGMHDLTYDYDSLMQSLSGLPSHERNIDVHDYVVLFFEQLLRKLKAEQTFDNVWIIQTYPDSKIDTLLSNYHDIDHILIDTKKEICIQRLKEQKRFNENTRKAFNLFSQKDFSKFRRLKTGN